ncbi:MAG: hypothetical protein LBQ35_05405, partial [Spirochaetaceae bacterium]|nr:hypothetical protein [Spirochaetaceae bacterium]
DAEERQQVPYNGSPQRPAASAPVALTLSYRTLSGVPPESPHAAPAGPGLYRVTLSFAGDRRYYGASREIDFAILAEQPPSPGKM